jgi:MFS transporter, DHA1 family, multidrug resistance protein
VKKLVHQDSSFYDSPALGNPFLRNRPFTVVWLSLFISIMGIAMVGPLLSAFAEDMGASGIWLSLAFSGFALSQIPLMPMVGRLSDRFGKKRFLLLGLLVYTIAAIGYLWSPSYQELIIFRVLSGIGAATMIPTAYAYIGELAPPGHEGKYMGILNISVMVGSGIGPLLGGAVHDSFGMDATFISMGILSAAGLLVVLLFLPETRLQRATDSDKIAGHFFPMLKDETMRGLVAFQLMWGLSYGAVFTFLPIFMIKVLGTSVAQVGLVLSARYILNGILSYPFGRLADRKNRVILVSVGMVATAIGTFFVPWIRQLIPLAGLFMVMAIFESSAIPAANAITVEKGRSMGMGFVMGVFNMAVAVGIIVGSITGGVIESSHGLSWVFCYISATGLLGVVLFNVFMRRGARHQGSAYSKLITSPATADKSRFPPDP